MSFNIAIVILLIITFITGIYFCMKYGNLNINEGFTNPVGVRCPNMLIQQGTKYFLYNSKIAKVPGVNPIQFNNLEDYVEFIDWQHSQGIRCPVLYLQYSYDAQGNPVYKSRPSIYDLQGGLPSTAATSSTNTSPSLITKDNNLQITTSTQPTTTNTYYTKAQTKEHLLYSPDPMKSNWGGQDYTQSLVDSGYYKGNEISLYIP
jgi:hypothetical protein